MGGTRGRHACRPTCLVGAREDGMLVNPHANSCSQNILNFFYCGTIIPRCDYFHSGSVFTRFYPRSACFTRNGTVWVWSVFWLGGGGAGARLGGGGDAKLGGGGGDAKLGGGGAGARLGGGGAGARLGGGGAGARLGGGGDAKLRGGGAGDRLGGGGAGARLEGGGAGARLGGGGAGARLGGVSLVTG